MINPPGKPRYSELLAQGVPEHKLNAELESRIATYQALPSEEREALIGAAFDDEPEPVEVTFVHIPPPPAEVEAAAAAAPLLGKVEALRDYLGEAGNPFDSTRQPRIGRRRGADRAARHRRPDGVGVRRSHLSEEHD